MPAGFHVASAYVDIHAESGGLRGEIKRAIQSAVSGEDGKVKLSVDAGSLRAKVESAIKTASAGAKGEVKLDLDAGALRSKIEGAVKAASAGARGEVKLDLDAGSLRAKISAATKAAGARVDVGMDLKDGPFKSKLASMVASGNAAKINVKMDVDSAAFTGKVKSAIQMASAEDVKIGVDLKDLAGFEAKLTALTTKHRTIKIDADIDFSAAHVAALKGMRATIKTDIDAAELQGKVRAAVAAAGIGTKIRIDTDIQYASKLAAFRAAIMGTRPKIHVDVDIDRDRWQQWLSEITSGSNGASNAIQGVGRSMTNASSLFTSSGGIMAGAFVAAGAAAVVLGNAIAMIGGALAAIALPAGIIALGAALQSASVDFGKFKSDLMGFGQEVSSSMAPAIQAAMGSVMTSLEGMRGQLTSMFSNAATLVQPMATAFTNLASGALPGITTALQNMQSAMPGIQQGFSQIGQGIGNFFKELTSNGQAIGQVWETMGAGINKVATQLGQSLSQIMSNPANVEMFARTFDTLAQGIQLAGSAIQSFAPAVNMMMSAFTAGAPAIEKMTQGLGALTTLMSGGNPIQGLKDLFGIGESSAEKSAKALKETAAAADAAAAAQARYAASAKGMQAEAIAQNLQQVKQAYADVAAVAGTTGGQIAASLTKSQQGAQALGQSFLQMSTNAQSSLGGQIALAQAISQAKAQQDGLKNSLTMTNGQLNLTSTKSQQAATALNQVAQAGVQAATSFAAQGNFTAAAASMDKARASIISLGQSFGLSKTQATELANSLLQIPDKEVQFKLNVESAKAGLDSVKAAFDKVGSEEKKVTVTAMTEPAQAALEALGFKIKDLGNGKVEVTANTDSAKAALDGLKTVLDALATGKKEVSISADQVPAVSAALKALGADIETLPNGDIKITAQDGATTVVHGIKSALDGIPESKSTKWSFAPSGPDPKTTATVLDDIPTSKSTALNVTGNAKTEAEGVVSSVTNIPGDKSTVITATGDAAEKAGEVKLKIDGLPGEKAIIVLVNVSGSEELDKLKELNNVQNKAISVMVNVTGTAELDKLKALNAVNNKSISVQVSVQGADQIEKLKALNSINNKSISVQVSVTGAEQVEKLKALNQVNNKNIVVNVSVTGADQIEKLKTLNQVNNKNIAVNVAITGQIDKIEQLRQLNTISNKNISVSVNLTGIEKLSEIKNLPSSKSVNVTVKESGLDGVKSKINGIAGKTVTIKVTETTIAGIKSKIAGIVGKTVTITVKESGVAAVKAAIAGIQGKTVTITVNTVKTGSAAGGGLMSHESLPGFAQGGRSMIGGGNVNGIGTATSDSILARLSNGEFVIRAAMVRKYGPEFLASINHGAYNPMANVMKGFPGFHSGGYVGGGSSSGSSSTDSAITKFINYTIKWGDTLTALARRFNTTVTELARINNISNPNLIYAGANLRIPVYGSGGGTGGGTTPPSPIQGVIGGTYPGDSNYLAPPNFRKIAVLMEKQAAAAEGQAQEAPKEVAGAEQMRELAGKFATISGQLGDVITGSINSPSTLASKIIAAGDLKALGGVFEELEKGLMTSLQQGSELTRFKQWLNQGANAIEFSKNQQDMYKKSLEETQKTLDDLKSKFDQLHDSIEQSIVSFANITKTGKAGASPETMISQMMKDAAKATAFNQNLQALSARGLNPQTMAMIAQAGVVDGGRTAASLLTSSPAQIAQINALQAQIGAVADATGTTAADAMYGAGIRMGEGLVAGLKSMIETIEMQIKILAQAMQDGLAQVMGIRSPSRVMYRFGENIAEGLFLGTRDKSEMVISGVRDLAQRMVVQAETVGPSGRVNSNSGTIGSDTSAGDLIIQGGIHVHIDGSNTDLSKASERKAIVDALIDDIFEGLRDRDRRRR